ncbi:hypothetical protein AB9F29_20705 [Falsihalocynthiibacter sp. S25ZX9]|uniref:hypothetical protein n=1 Tax=Falsihalocynthiibacter sp. S25ZX9 TaxID=3240870 RepID=UPI0035101BA3
METLRAEVLQGLQAGKSVEELQASVTLDAYSDWLGYDDMRAQNVQGMAEFLFSSGKVKVVTTRFCSRPNILLGGWCQTNSNSSQLG